MRTYAIWIAITAALLIPAASWGAVGLSGGTFQVVKGDSVIAEFTSLENAVWAAPLLQADTIQMTTIRPDLTDAQFRVWLDGSVVQTFPTKDQATTYAKDNEADSIDFPPQTVSPGR